MAEYTEAKLLHDVAKLLGSWWYSLQRQISSNIGCERAGIKLQICSVHFELLE
jgi:hypothetical protein